MPTSKPSWMEVAELVLKVVAGIVALVAFVIGLQQYERAQAWQRANVVISLIDSFNNDPKIQIACQMIDWDERDIKITDDRTMRFKNEMLLTALAVPAMDIAGSGGPGASVTKPGFADDETVIRDSFDRFFDFFDKLNALEKSELLRFSDYSYFYYWFEILRRIGEYKQDPRIQTAVDTYITQYHFFGIQDLLKEYEKNPRPLDIMGLEAVADRHASSTVKTR